MRTLKRVQRSKLRGPTKKAAPLLEQAVRKRKFETKPMRLLAMPKQVKPQLRLKNQKKNH